MNTRAKNEYIEGFDYLRAILPTFVVVWHAGGWGRSAIFTSNLAHHTFTLSDFINFHLLTLAVPLFMVMASYLQISRGASVFNLKRRLRRILILLTFWPATYLLFKFLDGSPNPLPTSWPDFLAFLMRGGNTMYYFFSSLLVISLVNHGLARLKTKSLMIGFITSIFLLAISPLITELTGIIFLSAFWNPMNFLAISFGVGLIFRESYYVQSHRKKLILILMILYVLFSVFEWQYDVSAVFLKFNYAIPLYTRPSLTFASLAILIIALEPRIRSNAICKYLSKYSLAVYCLHPFLMEAMRRFTEMPHLEVFLVKLSNIAFVKPFLPLLSFLWFTVPAENAHVPLGYIVYILLGCYLLAMMLRTYLKPEVLF